MNPQMNMIEELVKCPGCWYCSGYGGKRPCFNDRRVPTGKGRTMGPGEDGMIEVRMRFKSGDLLYFTCQECEVERFTNTGRLKSVHLKGIVGTRLLHLDLDDVSSITSVDLP